MPHIIALLMVLGVPAGAWAASDCLLGANLLGDQRALASVRAATEAACPCASYPGAPGLDRGAYRACARVVVDGALAATTLRSSCGSIAKRTYKRATCGVPTQVACARFKPGASAPHSCRVKKPASCVSKPAFTERVCGGETHCADVIDRTASTCVATHETGPYTPGVRVVTMTKPSAVTPSETRVLDTYVWYPAPAGGAPLDSALGAVVDAPLDAAGGPYPVVMFSHGSCGYPNQSTFLWPLVASYGFVVVAPPHPGNTLFEFPTCGTPSAIAASAVERPADVLFALDEMLAATADPGSPFFGALDDTRIGMAGHSFGGFTTYLVVAGDARFKVAVPLAPAVPGAPVLTIPSLHMLSQLDTYVDNTAIRTAYAAAQSPKFLIEIPNAGHFAFSNGCFPSPDCNPPTTLTQDEAHAVVLRWVPAFLERYLAGDATFTPFLTPPAPAGSVLQAAP